MPRLLFALSWLAVIFGLALPTLLPEVVNVTILVLMGVGLLLMPFDAGARAALRQPSVLVMMAAGIVLLVALLPTAESPDHILAIFILAPLWFCGMLLALFSRLGNRLTVTTIGLLALVGTSAAAAVTLYDVFVLGLRRGGWSVNNPIHLADLALMLGFASLVALYGTSRWRWLGLLGPVLALVAIMLSGSRGPLIAFVLVAVVAALFLIFTLWRGPRWVPWIAALAVAIGVASSPFVEVKLGPRTFSVAALVQEFSDGGPTDNSTLERFYMLQSAWGAFLASPIYGHGMIDYTTKAAQYSPPGNPFRPSSHLHNDVANFAVIGGTLGLLSYLMILLAPVVGAWRAAKDQRPPLLFLALMMSVGYFGMGLTNAMFGVLTQTVLYAVLLALLAHLAKRSRLEPGDAA